MAVTSFRPLPMPDSDLREDLDLPLVLLGEAEVHAEDLGDEERGLVAAGAGAELDDDVLLVVGIFGQEQDFELLLRRARGAARAWRALPAPWLLISGSASASMALASAMPSVILRYSRNFSTVGSMSRCCLAMAWNFFWSLTRVGSDMLRGRDLRNGLRFGRGGRT